MVSNQGSNSRYSVAGGAVLEFDMWGPNSMRLVAMTLDPGAVVDVNPVPLPPHCWPLSRRLRCTTTVESRGMGELRCWVCAYGAHCGQALRRFGTDRQRFGGVASTALGADEVRVEGLYSQWRVKRAGDERASPEPEPA